MAVTVLRKAFGQEYAGDRALRALSNVTAQPTNCGAQPGLLALDEREAQARQHRVPRDAGPAECRFSRLLALFLDDELNSFLGELTADPRCCEESFRKLGEAADSADGHANGRCSLAPTTTAQKTLFAIRVGEAGPPPTPSRLPRHPTGPPGPRRGDHG